MTRVNLVSPYSLADQHLMAEFRELKMVPAALLRSLKTRSEDAIHDSIPDTFTLNRGHVLFFMDKMRYLRSRYKAIEKELRERGYNIQKRNSRKLFITQVPKSFTVTEWEPSVSDVKVSVERIMLRLSEKDNWYRHYGTIERLSYFRKMYKSDINILMEI